MSRYCSIRSPTSSTRYTTKSDLTVGALLDQPMALRFTQVAGGTKTLRGSASAADVGIVMPGAFSGNWGGFAAGFDYIGGGVETLQACLAGQVQVLNISTDLYTLTPLVG
jgi:hypothetical protein